MRSSRFLASGENGTVQRMHGIFSRRSQAFVEHRAEHIHIDFAWRCLQDNVGHFTATKAWSVNEESVGFWLLIGLWVSVTREVLDPCGLSRLLRGACASIDCWSSFTSRLRDLHDFKLNKHLQFPKDPHTLRGSVIGPFWRLHKRVSNLLCRSLGDCPLPRVFHF